MPVFDEGTVVHTTRLVLGGKQVGESVQNREGVAAAKIARPGERERAGARYWYTEELGCAKEGVSCREWRAGRFKEGGDIIVYQGHRDEGEGRQSMA